MKKVFLVAVFAVGALVGTAWAQNCYWAADNCWPFGGDTPDAASCTSKSGIEVADCNSPPVVEYCSWPDGCHMLNNPNSPNTDPGNEGMTNRDVCIAYSNGLFNNSNCTGTPISGGPKTSGCIWDPDPTCHPMDPNAPDEDNPGMTKGDACALWGTPCTPSTPVISGLTTINLNVLVQAGSLHISSAREATMQLFDMSGKQVFSQKVPSGYSVVNLKDQKMGVYFAVVTSGSHKQTVKVTLK